MPSKSTSGLFTRRQAIGAAVAGAGGLLLPRSFRASAAPIEPISTQTPETPEPSSNSGGTPSEYFPLTGHNLKGPFLARWRASGGRDVLGMPISEERYAEGVGVVQTFETVTLMYDPALGDEWEMQAEHLPASVRSSVAPSSARAKTTSCPANAASCQFFEQTGHTISGRIASFWEDHGDLPVFGYPTTEPFKESGSNTTIQVFERVILEDRGPTDGVLVRKTASELAVAAGLLADPAFLPAPPTGGETKLVKSVDGLRLRSLPSLDGDIIVLLPDSAEFITAPNESGDWIGGYADGYSGWVSSEFLNAPPALPTISKSKWDPTIWQGAALGETNVRAEPTTTSEIVEILEYGAPLTVSDWVKGEEVFTGANLWAKVGNSQYIYARNVGRNAPVLPPPLPSDAPSIGKWIDVHLTQQLMVAYDGRDPIRVSVTTTGMAGWETPPGFYSILARVPNETMTSGAIGAEHYYKLEDVLFTQYFTDRGHAIHFAWWRTPETIGRPGSHGCLNLLLDDSQFFWDWANIGTPVYVHT